MKDNGASSIVALGCDGEDGLCLAGVSSGGQPSALPSADPYSDIRAGLERMARSIDQPSQQAALGLAGLVERGLIRVDANTNATVQRLRELAATYDVSVTAMV